MTDTILVVTEVALSEADVTHIVNFYADSDVDFAVLAPADTQQNRFTEFLNRVVYGEFKEAVDEVSDPQTPAEATTEATTELAETLHLLEAAGVTASGSVVADDPIPAIEAAIKAGNVREIVVVTQPRAVEDTFKRDVASRIERAVDLPVLHMYTGTLELG